MFIVVNLEFELSESLFSQCSTVKMLLQALFVYIRCGSIRDFSSLKHAKSNSMVYQDGVIDVQLCNLILYQYTLVYK